MYNIYRNTKQKLLKVNATIWFNKMCKIKELKPNYIHFNTRGKTPQDRRTTTTPSDIESIKKLNFFAVKNRP